MMTDGQGDDHGDGDSKGDDTATHLGVAAALDYDAKLNQTVVDGPLYSVRILENMHSRF